MVMYVKHCPGAGKCKSRAALPQVKIRKNLKKIVKETAGPFLFYTAVS